MKITQQSIIKHFNNPNAVGHGEWLLFKCANIKKLDVRIRRLHEALGTSHSYDEAAQAAVLKAIECWTKPRCLPFHGFLIPGTDLRVFRASKEEGYGHNAKFMAFGRSRPESVERTYLRGEVGAELTSTFVAR